VGTKEVLRFSQVVLKMSVRKHAYLRQSRVQKLLALARVKLECSLEILILYLVELKGLHGDALEAASAAQKRKTEEGHRGPPKPSDSAKRGH